MLFPEKEASGLRHLSRLHGVQKVGGATPPAPTTTDRNPSEIFRGIFSFVITGDYEAL
jgi:hypothetical protein